MRKSSVIGLPTPQKHIGKDSSPNHNHGELTDRDRAKWVWPSRVGGALQLDGGPGLEVPHDESLNLKDQLTLMCWVKFADFYDFGFNRRGRQQRSHLEVCPGRTSILRRVREPRSVGT